MTRSKDKPQVKLQDGTRDKAKGRSRNEPKTRPTDMPLDTFVDSLPEAQRGDARQLSALMQAVTGEPPVVWGGNIVGFGQYAQQYADGRQLPWPLLAFSPRVIASEETPRHQRTTAHLPTNNRPRFVHSPKKRPEERTAADNVPEVP